MSNIPSNEQIRTALDNAYAYAKTVQGGKNASYIPALAQVPSDLLAIAVVTVNGRPADCRFRGRTLCH